MVTNKKMTSQFNILPKLRKQESSPTCVGETLAQVIEYAYEMTFGKQKSFSSYSIYGNPNINENINTSHQGVNIKKALEKVMFISPVPEEDIKNLESNLTHEEIREYYKKEIEPVDNYNKEYTINSFQHIQKQDLNFKAIEKIINESQDKITPLVLWIDLYHKFNTRRKNEYGDYIVEDIEDDDREPNSTHTLIIIGTALIDGREYYYCQDSSSIRNDKNRLFLPADWKGIRDIFIPHYNSRTFGSSENYSKDTSVSVSIPRKTNFTNAKTGLDYYTKKDGEAIIGLKVLGNYELEDIELVGTYKRKMARKEYIDGYTYFWLYSPLIIEDKYSTVWYEFRYVDIQYAYYGVTYASDKSTNTQQTVVFPVEFIIEDDINTENIIDYEVGVELLEKDSEGRIFKKNPVTKIEYVEGLREELDNLKHIGDKPNQNLVDSLISKGIYASTSDSLSTNINKVNNIIDWDGKFTIDGTAFDYSTTTHLPSFVRDNKDKMKVLPQFNWNVTSSGRTYALFNNASNLEFICDINTSEATNGDFMFNGCKKLKKVPELDTSNMLTGKQMFCYCESLINIPHLNTGKMTDTKLMFYGCTNLEEVPPFDLSNSTNTESMFFKCKSLKKADGLDISSSTNASFMFSDCTSLKTVYGIKTENLQDATSMFRGCSNLEFVEKFDTSKIEKYTSMFRGCHKLDLDRMRKAGWEEKFLSTI